MNACKAQAEAIVKFELIFMIDKETARAKMFGRLLCS